MSLVQSSFFTLNTHENVCAMHLFKLYGVILCFIVHIISVTLSAFGGMTFWELIHVVV